MLAHESYFDTLQTLNSTTADWRSILAGLLVLRLIDAWLEDESLVANDTTALQAVREALAGVHERDPVLPLLCDLVDIVTQSEQASTSRIVSPMVEYGHRVAWKNHWSPSVDVFANLLSHALAVQDDKTIISTALPLGFTLQEMGQLEASDSAYSLALQRTDSTHETELYFRAHAALSQNLIVRGRLEKAEETLHTVIAETSALGFTEQRGFALHQLSCLTMVRGDYRTAIRICRTALKDISDCRKRNHLLINLGAACVGAGDHFNAKRILLAGLDQDLEERVRQRVLINLLEIAAKDTDQPMFNQYRQELDGTLVLPVMQADYHLFVAKGHYIFGNVAHARESWENALTIAATNGLIQTQRTIRAEMKTMGQSPNDQDSGDDNSSLFQ